MATMEPFLLMDRFAFALNKREVIDVFIDRNWQNVYYSGRI